jgi:nitrate reductase gamma subunit
VLALITGLLYFWGMDLLINPHTLGRWLPDSFTAWLASDAAVNLPLYVVLVGGVLMILGMLWLLVSLRKPRRVLFLERKSD